MNSIDSEIQKHYYDVGRGNSFEQARNDPVFWLGPVVSSCEIAEYGFVEYRETDFHSGPNYGKETGQTRFTIYINGHDIGTSGASLDQALVIAVAYKRDGINTQAARFFWKGTQPND